MSADDLVSVVVPAYNAEATLAATLDSVRRQSYRALEIVVVDDGSTDATPTIVRAAAAEDPRVRLLTAPNGGVAKARNAGIAASRGAFIAPVDADDLWHPEKIARQMEVMRAGGPEMGFVYTLHRRVDDQDRILHSSADSRIEGRTFLRSLLHNFVGNGSALLIRREALEAVGGYEPDLHAQGAQGCEDYLLQILIARSWTVGVVPQHLTGYRRTKGAMSVDVERMERSHLLTFDHVHRRHPETPTELLTAARAASLARLAAHRLLSRRDLRSAASTFAEAARLDLAVACRVAGHAVARPARGVATMWWRRVFRDRSRQVQHDFFEVDAARGNARLHEHPLAASLAALAAQEEGFVRHHVAPAASRGGATWAPACDLRARATS